MKVLVVPLVLFGLIVLCVAGTLSEQERITTSSRVYLLEKINPECMIGSQESREQAGRQSFYGWALTGKITIRIEGAVFSLPICRERFQEVMSQSRNRVEFLAFLPHTAMSSTPTQAAILQANAFEVGNIYSYSPDAPEFSLEYK